MASKRSRAFTSAIVLCSVAALLVATHGVSAIQAENGAAPSAAGLSSVMEGFRKLSSASDRFQQSQVERLKQWAITSADPRSKETAADTF
jgi:hypothetical protein